MRASTIMGRLDWVRANHGEQAVERVLVELAKEDPEHARAVRGAVVSSMWIPFDSLMALTITLDRLFGRGDLALVRPIAKHTARVMMPRLYRIFLKFGSVEYIMSKGAAVWSAHHNTGSAASERAPGGLRFSVSDMAATHPVHCLCVMGWAEAIVELCGAECLRVSEVTCRTRVGGRTCKYEVLYRQ